MMFEINFSHQPFLVVYLFVVPFVQIQNASAPMVGDDGLLLDLRNLFEWLGPDVWKDSGKVSVDFSHEMIEFRTWKSDLFKLHSSCHCLSNIAKCDSFDEDGWLEKAGWKKMDNEWRCISHWKRWLSGQPCYFYQRLHQVIKSVSLRMSETPTQSAKTKNASHKCCWFIGKGITNQG